LVVAGVVPMRDVLRWDQLNGSLGRDIRWAVMHRPLRSDFALARARIVEVMCRGLALSERVTSTTERDGVSKKGLRWVAVVRF
jgi:hypothetical protein